MFVDRGKGYFEPRQVKIGRRLGDRVEIVAGLKPGEQIAISGNFLIDSESRMKLAAAGFFRRSHVRIRSAVLMWMPIRPRTLGLKREIRGKSYFFCSEACQKHFDQTPERYVTRTIPDRALGGRRKIPERQVPADLAKDPACGLPVPMAAAQQAGRVSEYQGNTYYFDTDGCKQRFDQDPQHYLAENRQDLLVPPNPYNFQPSWRRPSPSRQFNSDAGQARSTSRSNHLPALTRFRSAPCFAADGLQVVRSRLPEHQPSNH